MGDFLMTVIPASLAATAVLVFFWALVLRIMDLERKARWAEDRREDVESKLTVLGNSQEGQAERVDRALESVAGMLGAIRSEMNEHEERISALVDLQFARAAQETADEVRRVEDVCQDLRKSLGALAVHLDAEVEPSKKKAAAA